MSLQSLIDWFHRQFHPHIFCFVLKEPPLPNIELYGLFPRWTSHRYMKNVACQVGGFQLNLLNWCHALRSTRLFTYCFSGQNVDVKPLIYPGAEKKKTKTKHISVGSQDATPELFPSNQCLSLLSSFGSLFVSLHCSS